MLPEGRIVSTEETCNVTSKLAHKLLFRVGVLFILALALALRSYALDWDEGTHLHPDERYLTMVSAAIEPPAHLGDYWNTATSSFNPANRGQPDYVYGTLPIFVTRLIGGAVDRACGEKPDFSATLLRLFLLGTSQPCWPGTYTGYAGIHLVGRALSVLADGVTLLALTLMARLLYGRRIALFAALLYAFAPLPIQHAHFFVVDSFATVFTAVTLALLVYAVRQQKSWAFFLAGITTGLGLACKVSIWPVAGMVALASLWHYDQAQGTYRLAWERQRLLLLAGAGGLALLAFRCAQPYAFMGPGFLGLKLNSHWLNLMRYIRLLMSGAIDTPPGHQWTGRAPVVFPWINITFWGLGLPAGLMAWLGWAVMGLQLWRRREWTHLLPWLWTTGLFFYIGTQWVKSMRYFLPIYPTLVLMAAWLLGGQTLARYRRLQRLALLAVGLGTVLWGWAFISIYRQPVTRITASRWMYEHLPTAVTLYITDESQVQVPFTPDGQLAAGESVRELFVPERDMTVYRVTLNKVRTADAAEGRRWVRLRLSPDPEGTSPIAETAQVVFLPAQETATIALTLPTVTLNAHQPVYLELSLLAGGPLRLETSVLGNEHWDDSLPLRLDARDPYWNWYRGLKSSPDGLMDMYFEDTPEKRAMLLDWLDEVDYIVLSSNRLYASIPRLAQRYPLTTAYYRALFDGSLGFELLADFVSFPRLGPCQFNDQESPFPIPPARYTNAASCTIPYPPAEEAFSVYDHPRVLIFAKTSAYSRERAEALLPASLLDNVIWTTPRDASRLTPDKTARLLLSDSMRAAQAAGGTWRELFHRNAPQNRSQLLAVVLWWAVLLLLGIIAFPWVRAALPDLQPVAYGLAKTVGLLTWAYVSWLPAALKLLPHTRLLLFGTLLALTALAAFLYYRDRQAWRDFWRTHHRELVFIEGSFALLYLAWVLVRWYNPDLWALYTGGEKPMDFAYLNAVIKSTWFPPYDPWFAGGAMNYYYFGFVLIGSLIKLTGIIPAVAYNLAIPTLFALTGTGAYALAVALSGRRSGQRARLVGLLGMLFVLLMGNLGELKLVFDGLKTLGGIEFESLIPGYPALVSAISGLGKVLFEGARFPFRPEWWYWNATRLIEPTDVYDPGAINEFPLFTFLFADLHAHAIAMPLTQVALALALQVAQRGWSRLAAARRITWLPAPHPALPLAMLVCGALRATNTWDYPTYLGLIALAPFLRLIGEQPEEEAWRDVARRALVTAALIFLGAELLFRPFTVNYVNAYGRFSIWTGGKTPLKTYLLMHGQFLFPLAVLALVQFIRALKRLRLTEQPDARLAFGALGFGGLALTLILANVLGVAIAWIAVPLGLLAALLLLDPQTPLPERSLWLWTGSALALTLLVELFVLQGDIGRMNTVFKFYLQVWMVLALSAAVAVEPIFSAIFLMSGREEPEPVQRLILRNPQGVGDGILAVMLALIFSGLLYPALAIPGRARDRWNPAAPHTLDGMAYMDTITHSERNAVIPLAADAGVIRWLQDNVTGSPVIMEGLSDIEYQWGNRISIYTGLPAVVGWRWHQVQQRMVMPGGTVEARQNEVRFFYDTPDADEAYAILQRYRVRYVILTPFERAYMTSPEGELKFKTLVEQGRLRVVYEDPIYHATLYEVTAP